MSKQEIFDRHIANRYDGIDKIIADDNFNEEDVRNYIRFQDCDSRIYNGYQNWLAFKGIADKIRRVGINGVLMRSDVIGTSKAAEELEGGEIAKYIVVKTKYGDIWVENDGRNIAYMR